MTQGSTENSGTTQQVSQQTPGTGEAPKGEAPKQAAPQVDITKMVNDRIKEVQGDVTKNVTKQIIRSLSGEEGKKESPIHTALVDNPEGFVETLVKHATTTAVETVEAKFATREEAAKSFTNIAQEYPDLKKVKQEVLAEFSNLDPERSIADRMTEAGKKVAERMGWKPQSQINKDKEVQDAAMSPGRGVGGSPEAVKKLSTSGNEYIASRKAQFMKVRNLDQKAS